VQRTVAERVWKWSMEKFAGGRNVMFATGGQPEPPSKRNPNLRWIFSTSLRRGDIDGNEGRELPNDGKLRLMIACRQEPRKGTNIVIESLPIIRERFPDAFLDIVGDGSLLDELKRQAAASGCSDRIKFHGKLGQAEVIDLLKKAHVFCYPTSASEGFPKVVLEALSCGLPIVTSRVSVLPQLITPDRGVALEAPTASDMAEAVSEICCDPSRYREMSLRAIEIAKEYSLEKWRDEIGAALRKAWHVSHLSSTEEMTLEIS
jgi:glycosyltransferase involved in cell wall biosynthesis